MSSLFLMITITDRRSTDGFLQLYKSHGVTVSMRTVGSGTAVQETLSTLGLEKTEKAVLLAVVTAESWQKIQKDLRRKMQIDVPGTGIAFIVPLSITNFGGGQVCVSCTGTVNPVVSRHRAPFTFVRPAGRGALPAEV